MRSASILSSRLQRSSSSSSAKHHQQQSKPHIVGNHGQKAVGSFPIAIAFAILATVLSFGGTIFLAVSMMTSSPRDGNHHGEGDFFSHTSLGLRQSAALQNQKMRMLRQTSESEKKYNSDILALQLQEDTPQNNGKNDETLLLLQPSSSSITNTNESHNDDISHHRGIMLKTPHGNIRIHFMPEYSGPASIQYLLSTLRSSSCVKHKGCLCERCQFYRAEPNLLLQGVIADSTPRNKELGPCPLSSAEREEYESKRRECPKHDPHCGCHGPIMTKGMVGWAGGGGGPDFFINTHEAPVEWWERQHTVWGEVRDEESLGVVEAFYDLPAHLTSMRMLDEAMEFYLELF